MYVWKLVMKSKWNHRCLENDSTVYLLNFAWTMRIIWNNLLHIASHSQTICRWKFPWRRSARYIQLFMYISITTWVFISVEYLKYFFKEHSWYSLFIYAISYIYSIMPSDGHAPLYPMLSIYQILGSYGYSICAYLVTFFGIHMFTYKQLYLFIKDVRIIFVDRNGNLYTFTRWVFLIERLLTAYLSAFVYLYISISFIILYMERMYTRVYYDVFSRFHEKFCTYAKY